MKKNSKFRHCFIQIIKEAYNFLILINDVNKIKLEGGVVRFELEGVNIILPKVSYYDLLKKERRIFLRKIVDYRSRPFAESLLRETIDILFESGYIPRDSSIIDIGCWIGDNTIVWSKKLIGSGVVWAIDPSERNLQFAQTVASLNAADNIKWVQAVCSDTIGAPLGIVGDADHAQFTEVTNAKLRIYKSTTLDEIVPQEFCSSIGLMHVDVEGFEEKVILGAKNLIEKSRPVILFEQHISKENPESIFNFLINNNYEIYMLNEVLPGCDLDCRNFISFPRERPCPVMESRQNFHGRSQQIWYAILGPRLIKIK